MRKVRKNSNQEKIVVTLIILFFQVGSLLGQDLSGKFYIKVKMSNISSIFREVNVHCTGMPEFHINTDNLWKGRTKTFTHYTNEFPTYWEFTIYNYYQNIKEVKEFKMQPYCSFSFIKEGIEFQVEIGPINTIFKIDSKDIGCENGKNIYIQVSHLLQCSDLNFQISNSSIGWTSFYISPRVINDKIYHNQEVEISYSDLPQSYNWTKEAFSLRLKRADGTYSSEIGEFFFISTPDILITPTPPKCSYSSDGQFVISNNTTYPIGKTIDLRLDVCKLDTKSSSSNYPDVMWTDPDTGQDYYWNDETTIVENNILAKDVQNYQTGNLANGVYAIKVFFNGSLCPVTRFEKFDVNPISLNISDLPIYTPSDGSSSYNIPKNGESIMIDGTITGNQGTYNVYCEDASKNKNVFSLGTSSLAEGAYTFWATDAKGCKSSDVNLSISDPDVVKASATAYAPQCHPNNTTDNTKTKGSITITVTDGGIPNFTAELSSSLLATPLIKSNFGKNQQQTFPNLSPGTYSLEITDQGGKIVYSKNDIVVAKAELKLSVSSFKDATCFNAQDGQITLSATGGNGGKIFSIGGVKGNSLNTLGGGSYTCRVDDSENCYDEQNQIIKKPSDLSFTLTTAVNKTKPASCSTASNGSIDFTVNGGYDSDAAFTITYTSGPTKITNANVTSAGRNITISGLKPGNYQVEVENSVGCFKNYPFTIGKIHLNNQFKISAITTTQNPPCSAKHLGKIIVTLANGTELKDGGYQLQIGSRTESNYTSGTEITGLAGPQVYNIKVTDGNNCSDSENYDLSIDVETLSFASNFPSSEPTSCKDGKDGIIKIKGAGGKKTDGSNTNYYYYKADNGSYSNAIPKITDSPYLFKEKTDLTYTVYVKDEAGCEISKSITVQPGINPLNNVNYSITDESCPASDNGAIKLTNIPVTWTDQLTFNLNGSSITPDINTDKSIATFSDLDAGTHQIKVSNTSVNCFLDINDIAVANLKNDEKISISDFIKVLPTCEDANNGELGIIVSRSDYSGSWSISLNGGKKGINSDFDAYYTGLDNTRYTITARDDDHCSKQQPVTIGLSDTRLDFDSGPTKTEATCSEIANGKIAVAAVNGVPFADGTYDYYLTDLSDNNRETKITNKTAIFTGLNANHHYEFRVQDAVQCSKIYQSEIIIGARPKITLSNPIVSPPSCLGGNDGSIKISIANDDAPEVTYSYLLFDENNHEVTTASFNKATGTFSGLSAGTYRVSVQGDDTCGENYDNIIVNEPTKIAISASTYQCITGNGLNNGSFTITATNGSENYAYEWIKDGNVVTSPTDVTDNTASGFTFEASDLTPGTYTFRLRDMNSCLYFDDGNSIWYEESFTLTEPNKLTLTPTIVHESCASANDGRITILGEGGWLCGSDYQSDCINTSTICGEWSGNNCTNPDYIYGIVINNAVQWQCKNIFEGLKPASYTVMVQDKAGNIASQEVTINARPLLSIAEIGTSIDATCPGYSNGQVKARVTNGVLDNGTFTYTITNKNTGQLLATLNQGADFSYKQLPASEDDYTLTVTDLNGCQASFNFSIGEPKPAQIKVTHNFIRDKDQDTGEIEAIVTNGNQQFDYEWYYNGAPTPFNGATKDTIILKKRLAGTYLLKVKDIHNCVYETSEWMERTIEIIEPDKKLQFSKQESTNVSCNGFGDATISVEATGGWGTNYDYSLNNAPWQANGDYTNLEPGDYSVTIRDEEEVTRTWEVTIT
ncbi:MAG: SprB repeat-containing protein, partial [Marinilabiliaceae bacterium]|nr:SprB repeat-containing protein [Marinilabiliaceae bacterium]